MIILPKALTRMIQIKTKCFIKNNFIFNLYIIIMPNYFKKLAGNASNMYSKIDKGASNFLLKPLLILVIKLVQAFKISEIRRRGLDGKLATFWKRTQH